MPAGDSFRAEQDAMADSRRLRLLRLRCGLVQRCRMVLDY
jgi:hypothetical protein